MCVWLKGCGLVCAGEDVSGGAVRADAGPDGPLHPRQGIEFGSHVCVEHSHVHANTVTSMFNTDMTPETVRFGVRMAEGLRFGVRRPRCIWRGCAG